MGFVSFWAEGCHVAVNYPLIANFRRDYANFTIYSGQNGSLTIDDGPNNLHYDLKDVLEISYGPSAFNDGIRACLTYNPPGAYKSGFQPDKAVCLSLSLDHIMMSLNGLIYS